MTAVVTSAGIVLYRPAAAPVARGAADPEIDTEVFVAHMGGPFWRRRPRAWSFPKGEYLDETPLDAARREFHEEIGVPAPDVPYVELGTFRQASGKRVTLFAGASDLVVETVRSTTFLVELPRGSGRMVSFPEVDDARWTSVATARTDLVAGQVPALDALLTLLRREEA
ncbi:MULTISPECIES: NUDIX domain-containing protein [unclassified Curtobacterium]|uniref:NUDIX domain-containing protein n=1 Tax=unclassified Curtobacterium TaxID=257496 RepID=UPI0021ACDF91|nr:MULTISPECIES: NUDIX domain-containing protein [unclassified Curtobacterium]